MQQEVNYYWYYHGLPFEDQEKISQAIQEKDFETFIFFYKKYNSQGILNGKIIEMDDVTFFCPIVYLPDRASYFNEVTQEIEYLYILQKENFEKITYNEREHG